MDNNMPLNNEGKNLAKELSRRCIEWSNLTIQTYNSAEDQLSGALVGAALAYVGISSSVGNTAKPNIYLAILFIMGLLLFLISIIFGFANYMKKMQLLRKNPDHLSEISNKLLFASNTYDIDDAISISDKIKAESKPWTLMLQVVFFILGVIIATAYILTERFLPVI